MIDISRMVFWLKDHFIRTSLPIEQVCLLKRLFFQFVHRLEKSLNHKGIALGTFLDIEGAFDNTSFRAIITAAGSVDVRKPVAVGSGPCLKADQYIPPLWEAV